MTDLKKLETIIQRLFPVTVEMEETHANLVFADHPTQAMTMAPDDWSALSDAVPELLALREEVGRLREALTEARVWHEAADKAISKQPNANQGHNGWNRLQHQEQIRLIDAALNQEGGQ